MQHLNPFRFYELASKLHALFNSATQSRVSDMFAPLSEAQAMLDGWIKGDILALETSKADASRLLDKLASLFNKYYIDPSSKQLKKPTGEDRMDPHELALLFALVEKFEHALAAEMARAPVYAAQKRGIYSTYDLVENADQCFGQEVRDVVPAESLTEFAVAGRALAFGLGTAAAMHLLRAVEMVLKMYYELFSGSEVAKSERTYSIYLKRLAAMADDEEETLRPDRRLLQMLAQIKEHYRNPLTSPESSISVGQATSLFGLATALITLMSEQIVARRTAGPVASKKAEEALTKVKEAAKVKKDDETDSDESDDDNESFDFRPKKKAS